MARAIDADALVESLTGVEVAWYLDGNYETYDSTTIMEIIDAQPTFDPVIRCRDCAVPHNKWTGCPKLNGLVPPDNFYCAFGVRRDSDGKVD